MLRGPGRAVVPRPRHDTFGERCHGPVQEVQHHPERAPTQTLAATQVAAPHDKEKVPLTTAQIVHREAEKTIPLQKGHAVKVQGQGPRSFTWACGNDHWVAQIIVSPLTTPAGAVRVMVPRTLLVQVPRVPGELAR